ncbi:D-alanyl-D-alanine carboxypeptidase/D-alanyl-D-alanine endopeptidase [Nocardioides pantholopis]|uniref:D-alanyl-D-alanine carboxypeptidase/D-alanyl-D-alanine endopeptidase n=1 Tax=Nocardioides pantholopis TaxID=2483798 RepID=UPI000F09684E|nr:D-alanyl-D-alanine carboxypeptidase/D-alanyl-D-alanine-endopeptidase [Nocardioides pantholopis]
MRRRDARHGQRSSEHGRVVTWLALLLVLVVGSAAFVGYRTDLADPWLEDGWVGERLDDVFGEQEPPGPEAVAAPAGLDLPDVVTPGPVADAALAAPLDARAVRRALAPYLRDDDLGRHVLAAVGGLDAAAPVFTQGGGTAIPASTTKVLTAVAALSVLDPAQAFTTRVVREGNRVTLVGGGDPLLAAAPPEEPTTPRPADVVTLARQAAQALLAQGVTRVRLDYDDSLFSGPAVNPRWPASYVPDGVVAPIGALWVDQGRPAQGTGRVADPARAAADAFATALTDAGVAVAGRPRHAVAGGAAIPVAEVVGPTVQDVVERVLLVSDNEASEVLVRQLGLAGAGEGSTTAGLRVVRDALAQAGVPTGDLVLHDGSGLSRANRIAPGTLLAALRLAATDPRPQLRGVLASLPVAAYTGSLSERFDEAAPAGRGRVRAKTGTLTGVSSLAGIATGVDGTPMLFVLMADRVATDDTLGARDALDGAAAALGACRCGTAG